MSRPRLNTIYIANHSRWKSFAVEEMNCNLLENIHSYMVALCGQALLLRGIMAVSLDKFHSY